MKKRLLLIFGLIFVLIVFIMSTNPNEISLLLILIPFVVVGLIIYTMILMIVELISKKEAI